MTYEWATSYGSVANDLALTELRTQHEEGDSALKVQRKFVNELHCAILSNLKLSPKDACTHIATYMANLIDAYRAASHEYDSQLMDEVSGCVGLALAVNGELVPSTENVERLQQAISHIAPLWCTSSFGAEFRIISVVGRTDHGKCK